MRRGEKEVRVAAGVPSAALFAAADGTPIVLDSLTKLAYWMSELGEVEHLVGWGVVSKPTTAGISLTLDEQNFTVWVTASGLTLELPPITSELLGYTWTVVLGVAGIVTIQPSAGDSILLPTSDTSISLTQKGNSVSLRVLDNTTTWGMV